MRQISKLNFFIMLVIKIFVYGCTQEVDPDIEQFVQWVKNQQQSQLEPLWDMTPIKPHPYQASHLRSPFETPDLRASEKPNSLELEENSDSVHPREVLEFYPIDSLKMVGYIQKIGIFCALIRDAQGNIHSVQVGHYMGQHRGRIEKIDEHGLEMIEKVHEKLGVEFDRKITLPLSS